MILLNNYDVFEQFIKEQGINLDKFDNQDSNRVHFSGNQKLDGGANVLLAYTFYKDAQFVDIEVFDLANLSNPLKKDNYLSLINELNSNARIATYSLNEQQEIKVMHSLFYNRTFDENLANLTIELSIALLQSCDESYPKFMKLQWA